MPLKGTGYPKAKNGEDNVSNTSRFIMILSSDLASYIDDG